jgi:excinuclease UvrABC helicase subunit UvrB
MMNESDNFSLAGGNYPVTDGDGEVGREHAEAVVRAVVGTLHRKVAGDLGDFVQQRLLRVGLMLHSALHSIDRLEQRKHLTEALDELDRAIKAVRGASLELIEGYDPLAE